MMRANQLLVIMGLLGVTLVGCAGKDKPDFALQDEHYQQILERQKAGIAPEPKADVDLSKDMTQDECDQLGDAHLQQGNFPMAKVQACRVRKRIRSSPYSSTEHKNKKKFSGHSLRSSSCS